MTRATTPRPTLAPFDAFHEAWLDLTATFARSLLTALGTVIGIGVLVSSLGLASSASARIAGRFDALAATEIVVNDPSAAAKDRGPATDGPLIPFDAPRRVSIIDGTVSSATLSTIESSTRVTGTPIIDPTQTTADLSVRAASPELPAVIDAALDGRFFDGFHDERAEPVAVIGANAARALGVTDIGRHPAVFIEGRPVLVIGIIINTQREPDLLNAVIVPDGYAARQLGLAGPQKLIVETRIGAADIVGRQIPYVLRPDVPDQMEVLIPPTPTFTRDQVASDTSVLFIVLAAVSLVIGGIGIANVTLVAVMERVSEIGLRRALGARRAHVAAEFLIESATLGFLGAVAGTAAGALIVVIVVSVLGWPAVINPMLLAAAPVLGAAIGVAAGAYPAWRASAIEPIEALRS